MKTVAMDTTVAEQREFEIFFLCSVVDKVEKKKIYIFLIYPYFHFFRRYVCWVVDKVEKKIFFFLDLPLFSLFPSICLSVCL